MYLLTLIENTTGNGIVTTAGIYDDYDDAVELLMNFQKKICMLCETDYEEVHLLENWEEESVQDKMFYFHYYFGVNDWHGNIEKVRKNTITTF